MKEGQPVSHNKTVHEIARNSIPHAQVGITHFDPETGSFTKIQQMDDGSVHAVTFARNPQPSAERPQTYIKTSVHIVADPNLKVTDPRFDIHPETATALKAIASKSTGQRG